MGRGKKIARTGEIGGTSYTRSEDPHGQER